MYKKKNIKNAFETSSTRVHRTIVTQRVCVRVYCYRRTRVQKALRRVVDT